MPDNPILAIGLSIPELTQQIIILAAVSFHVTLLILSISKPDSNLLNSISSISQISMQNMTKGTEATVEWISVYHDLEHNYTSKLISRCCWRIDVPSNGSSTVDIKFLNIEDEKPVVLPTGNAHEVFFQALDELGNSRNNGGDYFDISLAGERWRSRPPSKDIGNGTYSFMLQVHPDFAGDYNLTISLVYQNFGGFKFTIPKFVYNKQLRNIPMTFMRSDAKLVELQLCKKSDLNQGFWSGRWTRLAKNDTCEISDDGRYRCLEPNHPCTLPWCNGSLGMLESNGWVYSAHCSFALFSTKNAWDCLNNRWLFSWGDSTNVDTVRNILFFNLRVPLEKIAGLDRYFDKTFTNPKNVSQSVRVTQFWNGHFNISDNNLGLKTLSNKKYRDLLMSFFNGSVVPDTIFFNSGLHDGFYYIYLDRYVAGVDYAISFWKQIIRGVRERGLEIPNFIFRSTVASSVTEYYKRLNPSKMEVYNWILLEKLRATGLITSVIDYFDMTYPWHYDLICNDGSHYGRFPKKGEWFGRIGHQYFVDLMLGHIILNAICPR